MRRSIATVSLSGTLRQKLEAIAAARFDGIELFENDFIQFAGSAERPSQRWPRTSASASTSTSRSAISRACPRRNSSAAWSAPSASST